MVSFLVTWLGILMASVLVGVVVGGIVFAATQSDGAGKFVGFATIVITGMLIHPHINWGDEKQGDLAQAQSLVDGQSESLDATPSQDTSAPNDSGSRSWIVKFADGGFFYVALIAMLVGFVAGIGLFMNEKYDPITSLLFGELLLLFFIGVFPIGLALTALFSWILLAAIVTTVVCMASGHPHYAAAIAIIVAVVLHFAGAWDAVSFVSNNRIGIGILAAAWVAAGYAEALFEWRKIELSRSIAAKKKGDSFYRERKLDPTAEIPFELKMEATQFALANLEVIDVGSIRKYMGPLMRRAPYGLLSLADRALTTLVPEVWSIIYSLAFEGILTGYQDQARKNLTVEIESDQDESPKDRPSSEKPVRAY